MKNLKPFHYVIIVFALLALLSSMTGCIKPPIRQNPELEVADNYVNNYVRSGFNFDVEVYDNMRYLIVTRKSGQTGTAIAMVNLTKDSLECAVLKNSISH